MTVTVTVTVTATVAVTIAVTVAVTVAAALPLPPPAAAAAPASTVSSSTVGRVVTATTCRSPNSLAAVQLANKVSERWQPGRHDAHVEPRPFDAADERSLALFCAMLGPVLERQLLSNERFYAR